MEEQKTQSRAHTLVAHGICMECKAPAHVVFYKIFCLAANMERLGDCVKLKKKSDLSLFFN